MLKPDLQTPTLVLLHHFGGSARSWSEVLPLLAHVGRCVAPDLRGFGGFPAQPNGLDIADHADDVIGRMDALGIADAVLVGHSMGARIAMAIAARQLQRVRGLVLVAPSPPTPEPMDDAARRELRSARDSADAAEKLVRSIIAVPLAPEQLARTVADVLAADPDAWRAWVDHGSRRELTGLTATLTCPITILSGDHDQTVPTDLLRRELLSRVPQARLTVVAGAGHLLPLEAPAAVADAVRTMLEASGSSAQVHVQSPRSLLDSPVVTTATRRVLQERAAWKSAGQGFFSSEERATLRAVCEILVPQVSAAEDTPTRYRVDLAGEIETRLSADSGDGWRYASMPPDRDAYRLGLAALDDSAADLAGAAFRELLPSEQHQIILDLVEIDDHEIGRPWRSRGLDPQRLLRDWIAEVAEIYYSHIGGGLADLQYVGFADAQGWRRIGLNQLDPHELPRNAPTEVPIG